MTQPLTAGISKNQSWFDTVSNKYSSIDKTALANKVLKGAVNIGDAIVNFLGNTGIAGFKFHIPQTEQVKLESEITDYYSDINSNYQDHVVRKPITITMTGLVGDYFYSVNQIEDMLAMVVPTLSLVKQFLPQITSAAKQMIIKKYDERAVEDLAFSPSSSDLTQQNLDNLLDENSGLSFADNFGIKTSKSVGTSYQFNFNAMDLFTLFQNLYKLKSAQTRAFLFFEALWKSSALFSVETTWKRFDNMAILSVQPLRDENADITQFQVTMKQLNFTQSKSESAETVAGRMKEQAAKVSSKGVDKGQEVAA